MDEYCYGWSDADLLCKPQLIKLVCNVIAVALGLVLLYYTHVTKKTLKRFM